MANATVVGQNTVVKGTVSATGFSLTAGGTRMAASAQNTQIAATYAQDGTASAETRAIHVVVGSSGTIRDFQAGCIVACTSDATITLDLKKNGTTVLYGTFTLSSTQAAYETVSAAIQTTAVAAGDVLTAVVTVAAGAGSLGTGLFAHLRVDEDYASYTGT